jgi:hypothetical protein
MALQTANFEDLSAEVRLLNYPQCGIGKILKPIPGSRQAERGHLFDTMVTFYVVNCGIRA